MGLNLFGGNLSARLASIKLIASGSKPPCVDAAGDPHHVNPAIGEDFTWDAGLRVVLLRGLGVAFRDVEAGAGNSVDAVEAGTVLEVDIADLAAADQANLKTHSALTRTAL